MNDRYLFRGKRTDNGELVIGYLTKQRHSPKDPNYSPPYHLEFVIDHEEKGVMCTSFIEPTTIGQYTGLKDKNGKLIFEGDILEWVCSETEKDGSRQTAMGTVRFVASEYVVNWVDIVGDQASSLRRDLKCWSIQIYLPIIGNIHDNPELLKPPDAQ